VVRGEDENRRATTGPLHMCRPDRKIEDGAAPIARPLDFQGLHMGLRQCRRLGTVPSFGRRPRIG
jgi:hypothetical protein